MSEITMNDLMVAIKDVATDVNNLNARVGGLETEVKELNSRVSSLEADHTAMRKEMNEHFRRLNKKLSILSDEVLEARTDITFLEEKVN